MFIHEAAETELEIADKATLETGGAATAGAQSTPKKAAAREAESLEAEASNQAATPTRSSSEQESSPSASDPGSIHKSRLRAKTNQKGRKWRTNGQNAKDATEAVGEDSGALEADEVNEATPGTTENAEDTKQEEVALHVDVTDTTPSTASQAEEREEEAAGDGNAGVPPDSPELTIGA